MVLINKTIQHKDIKETLVKKIVQFVLEKENFNQKKSIKVVVNFIDDKLMSELNAKYKKRIGTTDILSFNFDEQEGAVYFLGELYLSVNMIEQNAIELHHSFEKELVVLLIHGTLHLLGYEHNNGKVKRDKMQAKEKEYLSSISNLIMKESLC